MIEDFFSLLKDATAEIREEFIHLPVADHEQENKEYRERVYCYELYHQFRCISSFISWEYNINGELDKSGHPLMRGEYVEGRTPDFLVHEPGDMGNNLVVLEVKPVSTHREGLRTDLKKLTAFQEYYEHSVHLTYGSDPGESRKVLDLAEDIASNCTDVDLALVDMWYHGGAETEAFSIEGKDRGPETSVSAYSQ